MLKKGDIIYLRVGFSDGSGSKVRPCIAIAKHNSDWNFLEVSSRSYLKDEELCVLLAKENYSLKVNSYVKLWKIHTVDEVKIPENPLIQCTLKQEDLQKILDKLGQYLAAPA